MEVVNKKIGIVLGPFAFLLLAYHLLFWGRVYPGVGVSGIDIGGRTKEQAYQLLGNTKPPTLVLIAEGQKDFMLTPSVLEIEYDIKNSVNRAYSFGRENDVIGNIKNKWTALTEKTNLPFVFKIREESLDEQIASISGQVTKEPVEPSVEIQNKTVIVNPGKAGTVVKIEELKREMLESVAFAKSDPIPVPLQSVSPELSDEETEELHKTAQGLVGKGMQIKLEDDILSYEDRDLVGLLSPQGLNQAKITSLVDSISQGVERPPLDARFLFEEGRVKEFAAAKGGITVKKAETEKEIENALERLLSTEEKRAIFNLPVVTSLPSLLTQDVNLLGIKELIGQGSSSFRGSAPTRTHNITLAASRLNGLLIRPGEVFSFNQALGDVSAYTGYQQAYIIKDGRTILGDGGGVCQVSTTLFRAALAAGLSIIERRAHSYRVSYYEQDSKPGIDATVYPPSVDLKFKNDTPGHILIQAKADPVNKSLVFELYGNSDGRVAEISSPRIWDIKPPPPPLYQDDPTLPAGATKQIEVAVVGTKAAFDYKVTRGGEVIFQKTFTSNYQPWRAVYLRGIKSQ